MNNRIPVLIWAYHVDLWPEILSLLLPVKDLIDVRVGLYEHNTDNFIVEDSIKIFDKYHISYHPNCGGDVLPFLLQLDSLDFNKSDVFLKIHTKKSLFGRKIEWRKILYYNLIGTRSIFLKNINKMTISEKITKAEDEQSKLLYELRQTDIALSQKGIAYYEKKKEYEKELYILNYYFNNFLKVSNNIIVNPWDHMNMVMTVQINIILAKLFFK